MSSPRRIRTVAVAAFASAAVLAGCSGQVRPPTAYGSVNPDGKGYYGNLMYGCTGVQPDADGRYREPTLGSAQFCRCTFDGLKETVPFDEAERFDEAQAKASPGEVTIPANIAKVQENCRTS